MSSPTSFPSIGPSSSTKVPLLKLPVIAQIAADDAIERTRSRANLVFGKSSFPNSANCNAQQAFAPAAGNAATESAGAPSHLGSFKYQSASDVRKAAAIEAWSNNPPTNARVISSQFKPPQLTQSFGSHPTQKWALRFSKKE